MFLTLLLPFSLVSSAPVVSPLAAILMQERATQRAATTQARLAETEKAGIEVPKSAGAAANVAAKAAVKEPEIVRGPILSFSPLLNQRINAPAISKFVYPPAPKFERTTNARHESATAARKVLSNDDIIQGIRSNSNPFQVNDAIYNLPGTNIDSSKKIPISKEAQEILDSMKVWEKLPKSLPNTPLRVAASARHVSSSSELFPTIEEHASASSPADLKPATDLAQVVESVEPKPPSPISQIQKAVPRAASHPNLPLSASSASASIINEDDLETLTLGRTRATSHSSNSLNSDVSQLTEETWELPSRSTSYSSASSVESDFSFIDHPMHAEELVTFSPPSSVSSSLSSAESAIEKAAPMLKKAVSSFF